MRLINRTIYFGLRNVRSRRQGRVEVNEEAEQAALEKIKFTEEELT
jgi:hypothetical protein